MLWCEEPERDRHHGTRARELLKTFEESLALHVADRDRLRKELTANEGAFEATQYRFSDCSDRYSSPPNQIARKDSEANHHAEVDPEEKGQYSIQSSRSRSYPT